jgi:hypothetical protein
MRAGFQRKPSKMGPDSNAAPGLYAFSGQSLPATQP